MKFKLSKIKSTSSDYPEKLRENAASTYFPHLWAIGNPRILDRRLVGFFCSQRCPGKVILRAFDLARALRDAEIPVTGGFHSSMEKECLNLLLCGEQPIVICPARGIERMRIPAAWRKPLAEERLLVLSPFEAKYRRATAALAEKRNLLVAGLADEILVAHAATGGKTEQICLENLEEGKRVYTLDLTENAHLIQGGVVGRSVSELMETFSKELEQREEEGH